MLGMQRRLSTPFLVLLTLPATAMGFALSVQISALSWILSTRYGLDLHDIGLVWAAGPLAGIVGQVLIGILSDEVWLWGGRRRPFLIIGGTLAALMLLALPSIGVISEQLGFDGILGVAIAVAIALDLSINVSFNPARSLITDVTPEGAERTRGYTWMQTVSGSFGVLAYAIGAAFGNVALIYVGAGIVLLFSLLPVFVVTEPRELPRIESSGGERTSVGSVLRLIEPLWAFLLYDIVAMSLRLAGITPTGYGLEIAFGTLAAVLIWRALRVRPPGCSCRGRLCGLPQGAGCELAELDRHADHVRLHDRVRAAALPHARRGRRRQGAVDELPLAERCCGAAAGAGAAAARTEVR